MMARHRERCRSDLLASCMWFNVVRARELTVIPSSLRRLRVLGSALALAAELPAAAFKHFRDDGAALGGPVGAY